jgi:hypothetical protein
LLADLLRQYPGSLLALECSDRWVSARGTAKYQDRAVSHPEELSQSVSPLALM